MSFKDFVMVSVKRGDYSIHSTSKNIKKCCFDSKSLHIIKYEYLFLHIKDE